MGDLEPLEKDVEKAESKPMIGDDTPNHKNEGKRKRSRATQIVDISCIGLNIISTVFLVFLNNWFVNPTSLHKVQKLIMR